MCISKHNKPLENRTNVSGYHADNRSLYTYVDTPKNVVSASIVIYNINNVYTVEIISLMFSASLFKKQGPDLNFSTVDYNWLVLYDR